MAAEKKQRALSELDKEWNESSEHIKLKRELRQEALRIVQDAARTQADFEKLVDMWDEMDDNRERRERYHEIRCAEVPVNRISARNGMIFPQWLMQFDVRQVQRGEFLDVIFDCPFLMHELVTDDALAKAIFDLKDVHKLLLFFLAVRQYSCQRVAEMQGQSDRNIRKVRTTIVNKIRKKLWQELNRRKAAGTALTHFQIEFLKSYSDKEGKL